MNKHGLTLTIAAVALALGFGIESASAAPLPFFYLVPTGPTTVPTVVPVGTASYQLWVDPSGVTTPPGLICSSPINGGCTGTWQINEVIIFLHGSLSQKAFSAIDVAPPFTFVNNTTPQILGFFAGDQNSTPFELGTMTIANDGSGPGDLTVWSGDYLDADGNDFNITAPQIIAVAAPIPEPGTLLLLGLGIGGLAAAVRGSRSRAT